MDFIQQLNSWANAEVTQGRIMVGIGAVVLFAIIGIFRSETELLRGALIPLGLLLIVLIGYGSYVIYSRPLHAKESIERYEKSKDTAMAQEVVKHTNDNKNGNSLLRIYPILMLLSIVTLFFLSTPYYKGMALGFSLLFMSFFIIDSGFVSRSNTVLEFLKKIEP